MNPINYAIQRIKNSIPKELLKIALTEEYYGYNNNVTIEEKILNKIIKGYLLLDLNLVTTISKKIDVSKCNVTYYQNPTKEYEYIIEVPSAITNGKSIYSASYIMYNTILPGMGLGNRSAVENSMSRLMQAHSTLNTLVVNRLEVVGENTILVNTGAINWVFMNSIMEVSIAPDANLSHVKGSAILDFGDMAVLAAKAWIRNTLEIQVDQGYIRGGHSIDAIKGKIDDYSSAEQDYIEKRTEWLKIALMLDVSFYQRFIEMQI